jgi:hypothetical protein
MQLLVELKGTSPLVMNNPRGMDKLDPLTRVIDELLDKKERTEADDAEISRLEWLRALHYDKSVGIFVPWAMPRRLLRDVGNLVDRNKGGKKVERGLAPASSRIPLIYDGPSEPETLYTDERFRWRSWAKVNGKGIMKTWPIFPEWTLQFEVELAEDILDLDHLVRFADWGGRYEGLGSAHRLGYGRFVATIASGATRSEVLTGGARHNGRTPATAGAARAQA